MCFVNVQVSRSRSPLNRFDLASRPLRSPLVLIQTVISLAQLRPCIQIPQHYTLLTDVGGCAKITFESER